MAGGMTDGVNKFFLVYHQGEAMHFEGEETLRDVADLAMRTLTCTMTPKQRESELNALIKGLKETFRSWDSPCSEDDEHEG